MSDYFDIDGKSGKKKTQQEKKKEKEIARKKAREVST